MHGARARLQLEEAAGLVLVVVVQVEARPAGSRPSAWTRLVRAAARKRAHRTRMHGVGVVAPTLSVVVVMTELAVVDRGVMEVARGGWIDGETGRSRCRHVAARLIRVDPLLIRPPGFISFHSTSADDARLFAIVLVTADMSHSQPGGHVCTITSADGRRRRRRRRPLLRAPSYVTLTDPTASCSALAIGQSFV